MAVEATSTQTFITDVQNKATDAITNLKNIASGYIITTVNTPTLAGGLGTYDNIPDTSLDIKTILDGLSAEWTTIAPPVIPSAPSLTGYTSPLWSETYWSNLKLLLTEFTSNITGSDDVDTVVTKLTSDTDKLSVAMYQADLERKQQALRDVYSAAELNTANRGFLFPNSLTTALKLNAQQKFQFDLSQTARDLIKYLMEWAKTNYQFSIAQAIDTHKADVDFNMRYANAIIETYTVSVRGALDAYKEQVLVAIEKVNAKIKEYNGRVDILRAKASITETSDRLELQQFAEEIKAKLGAAELQIKANADNTRLRTEAYAAVAQSASSLAQSAAQIAISINK